MWMKWYLMSVNLCPSKVSEKWIHLIFKSYRLENLNKQKQSSKNRTSQEISTMAYNEYLGQDSQRSEDNLTYHSLRQFWKTLESADFHILADHQLLMTQPTSPKLYPRVIRWNSFNSFWRKITMNLKHGFITYPVNMISIQKFLKLEKLKKAEILLVFMSEIKIILAINPRFLSNVEFMQENGLLQQLVVSLFMKFFTMLDILLNTIKQLMMISQLKMEIERMIHIIKKMWLVLWISIGILFFKWIPMGISIHTLKIECGERIDLLIMVIFVKALILIDSFLLVIWP